MKKVQPEQCDLSAALAPVAVSEPATLWQPVYDCSEERMYYYNALLQRADWNPRAADASAVIAPVHAVWLTVWDERFQRYGAQAQRRRGVGVAQYSNSTHTGSNDE